MDDHTYSWRVEAVVPTDWNGRPGHKNINLQVIAKDIQSCIDACKERQPEITFVKVFRDRYITDVIVT